MKMCHRIALPMYAFLTVTMFAVHAADTPKNTIDIKPDNPLVRLNGRWNRTAESAITINTGSEILAAFKGPGLTLHFDVSPYEPPLPHLWVRVDEGEWRETEIAKTIEVKPPEPGEATHIAHVVVKGLRERVRRWSPPLESAVIFRGISLPEGAELAIFPPPPRYRIEFIGDSITEGILAIRKGDRSEWPTINDGRRSYAYRTAELLGFEPRIVGFGRHGITIEGYGGIPRAINSFPYVYEGVEKDRWRPTVVVINLGTNDRNAAPEVFLDEYYLFIRKVRESYRRAYILCIRPFNGTHGRYVQAAVKRQRATGDQRVIYVDTTGWIDSETDTTDGVHPNLAGHEKAAQKLAAFIRETLSRRPAGK